ncbi:hypothetical protein HGRIS_003768 [Hohenbuehelia grisea]|uniref:F-box domain-containing protein n=1 Tax=Hohenbuehelia grisea TaxID=104357 RepID=A0ABR3JHB6_9AGAR
MQGHRYINLKGCPLFAPSHPRKMQLSVDFLPPAVFEEILSYLPLTSLIRGRGVSHHWRREITRAKLPLGRRDLLDLYDDVISSEWFHRTRSLVLYQNFRPFNRESFIFSIRLDLPKYHKASGLLYTDNVQSSDPWIPTVFETWVLEWPRRAVFPDMWPGLEVQFHNPDEKTWMLTIIGARFESGALLFLPAMQITADDPNGVDCFLLSNKSEGLQGSVAVAHPRRDKTDVTRVRSIVAMDWIYYLSLHAAKCSVKYTDRWYQKEILDGNA